MNNHRLIALSVATFLLTASTIHTLYVRPRLIERDGEYFIKVQVPHIRLGTEKYTEQELPAELINTTRNNLGLDYDDVCAYAAEPSIRPGITPRGIIACKSGQSFTNVHTTTGSATATPSNLQYSNYIGESVVPSKLIVDKAGSGKRITYCNGICKK